MSTLVFGFVARNGFGQVCFFPGRPGDLADGVPLPPLNADETLRHALAIAPQLAHDDDVAHILASELALTAPAPREITPGQWRCTLDEISSGGGETPATARSALATALLWRARAAALQDAEAAAREPS